MINENLQYDFSEFASKGIIRLDGEPVILCPACMTAIPKSKFSDINNHKISGVMCYADDCWKYIKLEEGINP